MPRRSPRLQALSLTSGAQENVLPNLEPPKPSIKRKRATIKKESIKEKMPKSTPVHNCLPRTTEHVVQSNFSHVQYVIGIDEAGRGPLAGPVVAAAVWAPQDLEGVVDSKKITLEYERERLYEALITMPQIQWAVAIIDAKRIDEINILQAALEGMRQAATALVNPQSLHLPRQQEASVKHNGSYVVSNCPKSVEEESSKPCPYYALIDGNKIPKDMPCPAESIVKGDGKEFCVAAASILAKVTRDRLMHGYDILYPKFNLKQHKGYPTADHMKAVAQHGASPIHRRTFAPLKHIQFDENGKAIKQ